MTTAAITYTEAPTSSSQATEPALEDHIRWVAVSVMASTPAATYRPPGATRRAHTARTGSGGTESSPPRPASRGRRARCGDDDARAGAAAGQEGHQRGERGDDRDVAHGDGVNRVTKGTPRSRAGATRCRRGALGAGGWASAPAGVDLGARGCGPRRRSGVTSVRRAHGGEPVADAEVRVHVGQPGETFSSFWRSLRTNTSTERSPRAIV